jgi:hypothetical protein
MPEVKIVGRGVDTLVLDVCYTNDRFQPVKRELNKLQHMARLSEAPIPTRWAFKGVVLFMQEKGAGGCLSRVIAQVRKSPLPVVAMEKEAHVQLIHQERCGEGERFAHKASPKRWRKVAFQRSM